jgi:hypothetical protein
VYCFAKPGTPKFVLGFTCFGYALGLTALMLLLFDLKEKNEGMSPDLILWWRVLYWS